MTKTPKLASVKTKIKVGAETAGVLPHRRVEALLRQHIRDGIFQLGAVLPKRSVLARDLGVAVGTLQRAINPLLRDGTLKATPKNGTVVTRGADSDAPAPPAPTTKTVAVLCASDRYVWEFTQDIPTADQRVVELFHQQLSDSGWEIFTPLPHRYKTEREAIALCRSEGAEILLAIDCAGVPDWLETVSAAAARENLPLLAVLSARSPLPVPQIYIDQWTTGYLAAQRLLLNGWRHLYLGELPTTADWWRERRDGAARLALDAADRGAAFTIWKLPAGKFPFPPLHPTPANNRAHEKTVGKLAAHYAENLRDAVKRGERPGLMGVDVMCREIIAQTTRRDLVAGRDFGLMGFDNSTLSLMLGLSSMIPPHRELGRLAAQMIAATARREPLPLLTPVPSGFIARRSA